jgi:hypothetical protein
VEFVVHEVAGMPLPTLIPPTSTHSSSIIRGWNNELVIGRRIKWGKETDRQTDIDR